MRSPRSPRSAPIAGAPGRTRRRRTSARPEARVAGGLAAWATALAIAACGGSASEPAGDVGRFDSARAFESIDRQVSLGPRPAGSDASRELADQLRAELPHGRFEPVPGGLRNVVGTIPGASPAIVVGAHYDTEVSPPDFVGANDGAAGTAAVLELARILPDELPPAHREIRFVLFDGEEEPAGCPEARFQECALRGSKAYVAAHPGEVGEMILLDYVANRGLSLPREANSDPALWARLRAAADAAGVADRFPATEQGVGVIDDHVPFLLDGIPAIDLIDFSYEHADTSADTPDKLDPAALDAVGEATARLLVELSRPGG